MSSPDFGDEPAQGPGLTDYDRKQPVLYAPLLDADECDAST
jgi:hypothetical protein